ncbi:MAG: DUF6515 family protein [Bacteroidota bacterium]
MKRLRFIIPLLLFVWLAPEASEAQVRRNRRTVVVTTNANKRQVRRITRRQVRRIHRRNRFRTYRTLPVGTRAVVFRNVNYYPVRGVYYVRRGGVYIRQLPPRGFRVATLSGSLVRLSVRGNPYIYAEGVFYRELDNAYELVAPPEGALIEELPEGVEEVLLEDMTAYELYDTLYAKTEEGYEVIGTLEDFE